MTPGLHQGLPQGYHQARQSHRPTVPWPGHPVHACQALRARKWRPAQQNLEILISIMKRVRAEIWFVLAAVVAIGLVLAWAEVRRPTASGEEWIQLSAPSVGSRTNSGVATPMVTFRVSNVGPRSVDFYVRWFECRAKGDRSLLATNQLESVQIPLWPGESTNLTVGISLAGVPVEDCLCCCQVWWFQREAPVRHAVDSLGQWWYDLFGATWHSIWQSGHLTNGTVFAANVEVEDYFRRMYGFTRTQWLEEPRDLARRQSARAQATFPLRFAARQGGAPTADEKATFAARSTFEDFCRASTKSARDAEPIASPNAVPPRR